MNVGIVWERDPKTGVFAKTLDNWPAGRAKASLIIDHGEPFGDLPLATAVEEVEWTITKGIPKHDRYAIVPHEAPAMPEEVKERLRAVSADRAARKAAEKPETENPFAGRGIVTIYGRRAGKKYEAQLHPDGTVHVGDKSFTSLSSAGQHVTGKSCNGWTFWFLSPDYSKESSMTTIRGKNASTSVPA